jgi:hypothetical protein
MGLFPRKQRSVPAYGMIALQGTERMVARPSKGQSAMTWKHQNEITELACHEIDAIAGATISGFGVKTDFVLAQKQLMESSYSGPRLAEWGVGYPGWQPRG